MTNSELKQLRTLLFLEVAEAAVHIGKCEPRTWQRWEKGDRAIPGDIQQEIKSLAITRLDMLQEQYNPADPMYKYFANYDEFHNETGASLVKWRLAQSIATALLCEREADKWRAEETI